MQGKRRNGISLLVPGQIVTAKPGRNGYGLKILSCNETLNDRLLTDRCTGISLLVSVQIAMAKLGCLGRVDNYCLATEHELPFLPIHCSLGDDACCIFLALSTTFSITGHLERDNTISGDLRSYFYIPGFKRFGQQYPCLLPNMKCDIYNWVNI